MSITWDVNFWGSDPEEGNDDCWYGESFGTYGEAAILFNAPVENQPGSQAYTIAYVEINGPCIQSVRKNPSFDGARCQRERDADMRSWRREIATEAGMLGGCNAYNDAMGW